MRSKWLLCLLPLALFAEEPRIQRIFFSSDPADLNAASFKNEQCIAIHNVPLIKCNEAFLKKLWKRYLGRRLTVANLRNLEDAVAEFYQEENRPIVRVSIPEQECTDGTVFVLVQEAELACWSIHCNRHFSAEKIEKELRIQPGCPVDLSVLSSDLAWLNENPFRIVDAVLSPGDNAGRTKIDLLVNDRWPYRFYTGADNTGTTTTGHYRLFTGINMGNLFGLSQRLSYQFTISTEFDRFLSHTAEYIAPLPWRHNLRFYGGYAKIKPHLHSPLIKQTGTNWQIDFRYEIPIFGSSLLHKFTAGADFKQTNNNIEFGGETIILHNIDVIQAEFGYFLGVQQRSYKASLQLELFASPGNLGGDNTTEAFRRLRPLANCHYAYARAEFSSAFDVRKTDWTVTADAWGQYSTANLIPSEQFELGGYNTIRGYQQNQVTTDIGAAASLELHSPSLHFLNTCRWKDSLYFLAFADLGWGRNHRRTLGEKHGVVLAGIGPGLRYNLGPYVMARFDLAFPLSKAPYSPHRSQYSYFGLTASY